MSDVANPSIEEIRPGLFRMPIPLPHSPLKLLNSYLIKGPERCLIIDTGMNREECLSAITTCLKKLNVDLARSDFFITHLHSDHLGLVPALATPTSRIFFNETEAPIVNNRQGDIEGHWRRLYEAFLVNGFPAEQLREAVARHPGRQYGPKQRMDFTTVKDGDLLNIGDYSFRCISTPGHSPGHICLFEAEKKILISGDHILFDITPNITWWANMTDSLARYLESLDLTYGLDAAITLPGHRSFMTDHRRRIEELRAHHKARLAEAMTALDGGSRTAFQVAPFISWDIKCDSWESFPLQQKWFAFGETMAHLSYLEQTGKVKKTMDGKQFVFSRI